MRRLVLGLPTVLQVELDYAILFHRGGTSQFSTIKIICPYWPLYFETDHRKRVWVLVQSALQPAPIFLHHRPFFVIEAVSPRASRVEWARKHAHEYFYMKTWNLSEVLQASATPLFDTSYCSRFL